jgi:hypothetical protein
VFMLPWWLHWTTSTSTARSRSLDRTLSAPVGLVPLLGGASYAGARGHRAERSFCEARANDLTPASRAASCPRP